MVASNLHVSVRLVFLSRDGRGPALIATTSCKDKHGLGQFIFTHATTFMCLSDVYFACHRGLDAAFVVCRRARSVWSTSNESLHTLGMPPAVIEEIFFHTRHGLTVPIC